MVNRRCVGCRKSKLPGRVVARCSFAVLEAVTAKDRLAWCWLERHFGGLATLRAGCCEELARSARSTVVIAAARAVARTATATATTAVAASATTTAVSTAAARGTSSATALSLACRAAVCATLWLREASLRIELLLTSSERELLPTITTCQRTISHRLLNLSGRDLCAART